MNEYNLAVVKRDVTGVIAAVDDLLEYTGRRIAEAELKTVPKCAREHYAQYLAWLQAWGEIARMLPKTIDIEMGRCLEIVDKNDAVNGMQRALTDAGDSLCP
jgi:hypothetical protein